MLFYSRSVYNFIYMMLPQNSERLKSGPTKILFQSLSTELSDKGSSNFLCQSRINNQHSQKQSTKQGKKIKVSKILSHSNLKSQVNHLTAGQNQPIAKEINQKPSFKSPDSNQPGFKKQIQPQLSRVKSQKSSFVTIQDHIHETAKNNKKKFKLFYEVKKKSKKVNHCSNDLQNNNMSSTVSDSWVKTSKFSQHSEKMNANKNPTKKSEAGEENKKSHRKINLQLKIRQIKTKASQPIKQQEIYQHSKVVKSRSSNSRRSSESRRKQSSLKLKHIKPNQKKGKSLCPEEQKQNQVNHVVTPSKRESNLQSQQYSELKSVQKDINIGSKGQYNKEEEDHTPLRKLPSIKEQKNEETISRSLKAIDPISIDQSHSKNNQMTALHLSINSVCHEPRHIRNSFQCILQTTQIRQSALRNQIQSTLSQIERTRQDINIQKFSEPKTLGQMGSGISEVQYKMSVVEKIQFHIEIINTLSNFVYKSTQLEFLKEDWEQLNFLIYKKFYIQRMKALHFLKKYPIKNPFCIKRANIQTKQILKALKEQQTEIKRIKKQLQTENATIKKNLQLFYQQFQKEKQGQKINLFQYDNFSQWVFKQLWDQIQLFSYSQSHNQLELQDRICKSLQVGFLISELNGNYVVPFQDAQIATHRKLQKIYIEDNIKVFQRCIVNKIK